MGDQTQKHMPNVQRCGVEKRFRFFYLEKVKKKTDTSKYCKFRLKGRIFKKSRGPSQIAINEEVE